MFDTVHCGRFQVLFRSVSEEPQLARGGTSLHASDACQWHPLQLLWRSICTCQFPPPTDRVQQLEESLQVCQALALAGQFAAATMHEVNGPLEAITNLNYLVQTNSDDGEQVRSYSSLIYEQLLVLSTISRQTLSFYHSSETVEPIPIAPLAEAALRIHHKKIAAKEIRLLKKLPRDVTVESHAGAMLQVFSNLIGNAVDALPNKGTLHIRARCTDEKRISFSSITDAEFLPQSGAGSSNHFSVQKGTEGRGWDWRSPKRLSTNIAAGSEAGPARAPAEAELPSASRCPYGLSWLQPRNKVRSMSHEEHTVPSSGFYIRVRALGSEHVRSTQFFSPENGGYPLRSDAKGWLLCQERLRI